MAESTEPSQLTGPSPRKEEQVVQDPGLRGGHHDLPHEGGDDRRHHERHQHHGAQDPAPEDAAVEQQGHAQPEDHLDNTATTA